MAIILYFIYSYGLVDILKGHNKDGGAYIDGNLFIAIADTFTECDVLLNDA